MRIMGTMYEYKPEAIRIKAIKYDGGYMPDTKKFSVDPGLTTYDILKSILTKAFDAQQDFTVYYRVLDDYNQETYLPLLSDWDLDAAFVRAADPCLCLKVEMKIYEEVGKEWSGPSTSFSSWISDKKRIQDLIMNHVEKTVSVVRGALNFIEDIQQAQDVINLPLQNPITDNDFRKYLDPIGHLVKAKELKSAVYLGGVEHSLRKVVWKHLLNVYPEGLSGQRRIEYIKKKSYEYEQLKSAWRNITNDEKMKQDLAFVTSMVTKDVVRTDRQHDFYAEGDKGDNQNIVYLFNILTTYALNHPSVSYCQGMSDLASPLLFAMENEAHTYICFCSLMRRLGSNFLIDGVAMTQRFQHLADGLLYYDPTFYAYLKAHQADDLLFCYRWLLLEMKREFAFEDALRMLEVMWSALPPVNVTEELPLYEVRFCSTSQFPPPPSPNPRETPYTKVCALRRQTSSGKPLMINRSLDESVIAKRRLRSSIHNVPKKYSSMDDAAVLSDNSGPAKSGLENSKVSASTLITSRVELSRRFQSLLEGNKESGNDGANKKEVVVPNKMVKNFKEFLTLEKKSGGRRNASDADESNSSPDELSEYKPMTTPTYEKLNTDLGTAEEKVRNVRTEKSGDENSSSPEDSSDYNPMTMSAYQQLSKDIENLQKQVFSKDVEKNKDSDAGKTSGEEIFIWENPLKDELPQEDKSEVVVKRSISGDGKSSLPAVQTSNQVYLPESSYNGKSSSFGDFELGSTFKGKEKVVLPGPLKFGGGNPFLMFLCISVLRQHRDIIMKSNMDYNEIAIHFDKMVRKHNVNRVLNQARHMYTAYLKEHRQNFLHV